jgi:NADH-quinone oxidoreductase subunit E
MNEKGESMNCNCGEELKLKLEPELESYTEGALIPVLQKAQELYGWLPADVIAYIAERTGVKPAKVMGVVTFYTQFRTKPVGKNLILLCQGTACHVNGSGAIEDAIREHLGVGEGDITEDGLFTYNNVACLGCCSLAPVMMIGDKFYGKLTKASTVKVLEEIVKCDVQGAPPPEVENEN